MFPVLLTLGPVTIYTFNLIIVLGFLLGGFVYWKRAHDEHYEDDQVFDIGLLAVLFGLFVSRIGYIIFHVTDFQLNVLAWISVFQRPGLHETVGLLGGLWMLGWLARRRKWDHFELVDYGAIGVSLFLVVIWFGRFLAGSQIGTPTQLPWGVTFPNTFDVRHPLQLYMLCSWLFVFVLLQRLEKKYRFYQWYRANKQSAQSGFVVSIFLIAYGMVHLLFSRFRLTDVMLGMISIDVISYIALILGGLWLLYWRSGHSGGKKASPRRSTTQQRVQLGWFQRVFRKR